MTRKNQSAILERCVLSVLASTGVEVDVILVDNTGTDETVDRLGERAGVRVVRPGRNLGFAGGNNVGIRVEDADGGERFKVSGRGGLFGSTP